MVIMPHDVKPEEQRTGSPREVLLIFLRLGVTCFGGPIAHIGYFRNEFVVRRRWLDERAYADLVGLCQFLPGAASSQVGFSIGLIRAGYAGGLAAWAGFTLPSALILTLFAYSANTVAGPNSAGLLHGLKLAAVAIVAQAVWGMARTLCPDRMRASIAVTAALTVLFATSPFAQIAAIILGGIAGQWLCRSPQVSDDEHIKVSVSRRAGIGALALFLALLFGLPVLTRRGAPEYVSLFDAFYRSGALVFGCGHVVLPLLHEAFVTPGSVSDDAFLAGYGAAQAVPGPLFTFAAYLGAIVRQSPHGIPGEALGLLGIFLPGILILIGALPFWDTFRRQPAAQAIMRGVNASVVGLLAAALYTPIWTKSVKSAGDFGIVLLGFVLLTVWRMPPLVVVAISALGGIVIELVAH
ncbi:chromate efflux transporter [Kozakia baliensis]|uniref:chromate efflux transporter n=1 Tax=Kozakia baliensis TaxID=153496 RepID=UPI00087DCC44|nr:chromate efflux transporter [Kozakia baliensis]AOX21602.1 chromate transporter [Kozakia baliensis]